MTFVRLSFLLLSFSLGTLSFPCMSHSSCLAVFSAKEEIADKLSKSDMSLYKGQEAYVRFVRELKKTDSMDYVFQEVSKLLGKSKMQELEWQAFHGSVSEFEEYHAEF